MLPLRAEPAQEPADLNVDVVTDGLRRANDELGGFARKLGDEPVAGVPLFAKCVQPQHQVHKSRLAAAAGPETAAFSTFCGRTMTVRGSG